MGSTIYFSETNMRWKEECKVITFYEFQFLVTRFHLINTDSSRIRDKNNDDGKNPNSAHVIRQNYSTGMWNV